ncbi:MAG: response regulator transcription factor [Magnetococcales bacterium]|nr:response regulator transcription factor [Magnetococcales bacterium]
MKKVIIVEDNINLRETIVDFLTLRGFKAFGVGTEEEMYQTLNHKQEPTVIILDVMLEQDNGFRIAKQIRTHDSHTGIIILTSLNSTQDHVVGLEAGADIFLTKPIDLMVLEAKINALFRRVDLNRATPPSDEWALNTTTWELQSPEGHLIPLTGMEKSLLTALTNKPGKTVSFSQIANQMETASDDSDEHRIAVLINRLRKKVKDNSNFTLPIRSNRGVGYSFTAKISLGKP